MAPVLAILWIGVASSRRPSHLSAFAMPATSVSPFTISSSSSVSSIPVLCLNVFSFEELILMIRDVWNLAQLTYRPNQSLNCKYCLNVCNVCIFCPWKDSTKMTSFCASQMSHCHTVKLTRARIDAPWILMECDGKPTINLKYLIYHWWLYVQALHYQTGNG